MGTENGGKLGGEIGRCGGTGEQCEKPLESTERAHCTLFDHIWSRCHPTLRWQIPPSLLPFNKKDGPDGQLGKPGPLLHFFYGITDLSDMQPSWAMQFCSR